MVRTTVGRSATALAAMAALALIGAGSSAAETVACGATITADTTLSADLNCSGDGDGLIVADAATLDLNGHTIRGSGSGIGVLVFGGTGDGGRTAGIVENGTVRGFGIGIQGSTGVTNMTVVGNGVGIFITRFGIGPRIRVENSTVIRNAGTGIEINVGTHRVDVADNRVLFNGGDGILVGSEADLGTYTNNLIQGNGGNGLTTHNAVSTVVGNTARDNGADGIHMSEDTVGGSSYFIASNLAVGNGGLGIWTWTYSRPPPMTDGGGNAASRNGDPAQCVNIVCARNRGQT